MQSYTDTLQDAALNQAFPLVVDCKFQEMSLFDRDGG